MTDTETDTEPEGEYDTGRRGRIDETSDVVGRIVENVEQVMIGQHDVIEHVMTALLARGHVLLDDVPGVGKTMLARAIATSLGGEFKRVQFTPDLLPTDVTGVNVFNQQTGEFEFRPGPVFANVVLGDEINRAPPKTQSALLEAMEERQVTVDGETRTLPDPFTVIATQNTVEGDRAYDLPMAEVDRFMMKLELGYPDHDEETALLDRASGRHPIDDLDPVATPADVRRARSAVDDLTVSVHIREYVTRLARFTRDRADLGVSPRGAIALLEAAKARALLESREYVIPDDVQREARVVLPHRIRTDREQPGDELVETALGSVSVE